LETIATFRPEIAVILNVTPDHLDRHGTFANYTLAKERIFENQHAEDAVVLNADDAITVNAAVRAKSRVYWFSRLKPVMQGAYLDAGEVVFRQSADAAPERILPLDKIPLRGVHNTENVLAAVCATRLAGVPAAAIRVAVEAFRAVEHRLEFVASVNGVEYYNDSKATNVDATMKAIAAFPGAVHLILGGKDKNSDYTLLRKLLEERVAAVYTIGTAAEKIESQIQGAAKIVSAGTMEQAVEKAAQAAGPGEVVLLAPACSSFDQFDNYEHRGRVFKELVLARRGLDVWQSA
jgi:UDP-N-acetylmuramoylalanine--D-glutamate ligase